ncbi:MAG: hypothetical protein ACFFEY_19815 [Candidatus Thorarchaeota archaeon]
MNYDFFFCGASWAWGGELDLLQPEDPTFREKNRYSHYVGERLNKSYYNVSQPGRSNDWITRSLVDWFEDGNTCSVAVIQFESYVRMSYYNQQGEYITIRPTTVYRKKDPFAQFYRNYFAECYSDYAGYQMYAKNLCLVDLYLKDKGVKPIYLTTQRFLPELKRDHFGRYSKDIIVKEFTDIIGERNDEFYCSKGYEHNTMGWHPNPEGHSKIADYIISQL